MARDEKPVRLRPVDEDVEESTPVIRLGNREVRGPQPQIPMLRLDPEPRHEPEVSRRLNLPDKEEVELRSFQPGIDVLIEPEKAETEQPEERWGSATENRHPIPWGWFVLIALIIVGAVAWSVFRVNESDSEVAKVRRESENLLVDEEAEEKEATRLVSKIESTIGKFFEVRTPKDLLPFCRHQERVGPMIQEYYRTKPVFTGSVRGIRSLQPLTIANRGNFWAASVLLNPSGMKNLLLEVQGSGEVLVDWETLVCYQPMPWDDFVSKRPAGRSLDFRVYAEPDSFHSHEFSNSDQWDCYRLTALEGEEALFGYVQAGSDNAKRIRSVIQLNGGRRTALIVRLIVPEGLKSRRGVVIEGLVSERWIHVDPPDSGP